MEQVGQASPAESNPTQIQPVLDKLRTISEADIKPGLDAKAQVDPAVGIIIVPLPEQGSVTAEDGQVYKYWSARVLPKTHVNPHAHFVGDEPYKLLTGEGIMHIGTIRGEGEAREVVWEPATVRQTGDEIIVRGGEVHSLENTGDVPLDFTFACPDSHLSDDQDRTITVTFQNGLPQYQNS